jgi:hypothetical protein
MFYENSFLIDLWFMANTNACISICHNFHKSLCACIILVNNLIGIKNNNL